MQCIEELIRCGYDFKINGDKINYKLTAKYVAADAEKVKALLRELGENKLAAMEYIKRIFTYEIKEDINFGFKISSCLKTQDEGAIRLLRLDTNLKARKLIFTGVFLDNESMELWNSQGD